MRYDRFVATLTILLILAAPAMTMSLVFAKEIPVPYTLEDRERLVRLETKVDERFEQMDKRLDDIQGNIRMLAVIFAGIVVCTIGFAIWDRRTAVRPLEAKLKALEEGKVDGMLGVFRALAESENKFVELLRRFNLL